jgi:hypothetical protein
MHIRPAVGAKPEQNGPLGTTERGGEGNINIKTVSGSSLMVVRYTFQTNTIIHF